MGLNPLGRRWRRTSGAATVAALIITTLLVSTASARTPTRGSATDGLQALRVAATAAAANPPAGVDPRTYQMALEAYLWGYPLVVMARTRAILVCGAAVNTFISQSTLAGPSSRLVVTPNVDTLYSSAFLDLRSGPVVLRTPALGDRYYVFQFLDMYTNTITNLGTRTVGEGPNAFVVTGPGWRGRLPAGTHRIDAPTPDVWIIGRTLPTSVADVPTVAALQHGYTLAPLDRGAPAPGSGGTPCGGPPRPALNATGAQFFDELGQALTANPPPSSDAPVLRDLATVGIGPGQRPSTNANPAVVAALAQSVAVGTSAIARAAARNRAAVNGWSQLQHIGTYDHDYVTRAAIAQSTLGANVPAESMYYQTGADLTGVPLVGARPVVIHFAAHQLPPLHRHGFWSVTLYGPDHFLVANPLDRYAIGDRTVGLQSGADGSLDLYVGASDPAGQEANWLPAPVGSFSLVLRAYLPGVTIRTGTWRPPPIRPAAP